MLFLLLLFCPTAAASINHADCTEKPLWRSVNENKNFVIDQYRSKKIPVEAENLSGQELIDYVNSQQTLWKICDTANLKILVYITASTIFPSARPFVSSLWPTSASYAVPRMNQLAAAPNKFDSYENRVKYGLLGVNHVKLSVEDKKHLSPTRYLNTYIPETFDAREEWSECESIKNIRDQSSCGSCWAFGAVEAISDRICIASKGKTQVTLSADDLLSCCKSCGFGCDGGNPMAAWQYWVSEGIVTGSNYTLHSGCKPYPFPPCEHHSNKTHYEPCKHDLYPTPKCERKCSAGYGKSYVSDKYYGKRAYAVESEVESIQKEIMTMGPVEAAFEVYTDFLTYSGGIYKHTAGTLGGGHAVKILGWGVDQGVPYWLVANSWNTDWGENGYFRILRGVDECGIESGIVAGIPKRKTMSKVHGWIKSIAT